MSDVGNLPALDRRERRRAGPLAIGRLARCTDGFAEHVKGRRARIIYCHLVIIAGRQDDRHDGVPFLDLFGQHDAVVAAGHQHVGEDELEAV